MCLKSIWTHQETQVWGFGAGWTGNVGVRSGAVCSFPAGRNNPAVVCCHGTSTKAFVLRWSSQQNRVAHETVDLTRPLFFSKIYCYVWALFSIQKSTHSLASVGWSGTEQLWGMTQSCIWGGRNAPGFQEELDSRKGLHFPECNESRDLIRVKNPHLAQKPTECLISVIFSIQV